MTELHQEETMRLQKYLAQSGIASRRKAEEFIERGLVTVNGEVATIGMKVNPKIDQVEIGDEVITETEEFVYYKMNKPRGIVTTCVSRGDTGILDIVEFPERVFPIGRLDKDTTGLILLTNDGRLSNYLMHPRHGHEKEYVVDVYGKIDDSALERMSAGVEILGAMTKPAVVTRLATGRFSIILKEGKNRQIRRMVEVVKSEVKRLKRIRVENIMLGDLPEGLYEPLSKKEKEELFRRTGLSNNGL